jgi:hypothetical protein
MIKEINLDGIFLPPLVGYFTAAGLIWFLLRFILRKAGFYTYVWHPPLFNTALYVIILGGVVAALT